MFNILVKRRGQAVSILRRHAVKRQQNCSASTTSFLTCEPVVLGSLQSRRDNVRDQLCRSKHARNIGISCRNYASLPRAMEEKTKASAFIFDGHEDNFAHMIMQKREKYAENIAQPLPDYKDEVTGEEVERYTTQSWNAVPIPEIIEAFKRMSHYAHKNRENLVDEKYQKFLRYLIANCEKFTDKEIREILLSIALWPWMFTRHDKNFKALYHAFDKECLRRAPTWSFNELLLTVDHWYRLRLARYSEFCTYTVTKLSRRPNRLTPSNLVQYLFYINVTRRNPGTMFNLEYKAEQCIDDLDLDELAIIAMGFFKSQTPIRSTQLLIQIIHRVIKDIDTIHEIALSAFLKTIRYSAQMQKESGIVWELLVSTLSQVPRLSLQALVHIITTCVKIRIFHPELLTAIANRFNQDIQHARLKDMERLVLGLTCFNFTPDLKPDIFETVIQELRLPDQQSDMDRYQRSLAYLLQYLSVVNIYPKDLIAFALDPENLKKVYGPRAFNLGTAIYAVDLNIDVELPDYTGPRLDSKARSIVAKPYVSWIPERDGKPPSARHQFMWEVMDTCQEIFGSKEIFHADWVLPQYREADLIICLDKNNSPLPVKDILSEKPLGSVKRAPENCPEGTRWLAIVLGVQNCYIRDTTRFLGKDSVKIRQLQRIGYTPITIPWYDWYISGQDTGYKKKYLKQRLLV